MTSEPKAFASLSSGLLARKGAARPAMRPQGFGQAGSKLIALAGVPFVMPTVVVAAALGALLGPRGLVNACQQGCAQGNTFQAAAPIPRGTAAAIITAIIVATV